MLGGISYPRRLEVEFKSFNDFQQMQILIIYYNIWFPLKLTSIFSLCWIFVAVLISLFSKWHLFLVSSCVAGWHFSFINACFLFVLHFQFVFNFFATRHLFECQSDVLRTFLFMCGAPCMCCKFRKSTGINVFFISVFCSGLNITVATLDSISAEHGLMHTAETMWCMVRRWRAVRDFIFNSRSLLRCSNIPSGIRMAADRTLKSSMSATCRSLTREKNGDERIWFETFTTNSAE